MRYEYIRLRVICSVIRRSQQLEVRAAELTRGGLHESFTDLGGREIFQSRPSATGVDELRDKGETDPMLWHHGWVEGLHRQE
jgi:hypothetical protein